MEENTELIRNGFVPEKILSGYYTKTKKKEKVVKNGKSHRGSQSN